MTFPFVREALDDDRMTLHGLRHDISAGLLEQYDCATDRFETI